MDDAERLQESQAVFSQLENFEDTKQTRKEFYSEKYRQMKRKKR